MRVRFAIVIAVAATLLLVGEAAGSPVLTKGQAHQATKNESRYLCNNLDIRCDSYRVGACRALSVRRVDCDSRLDFLAPGLACTWTEQWYLRRNGRLEQNVKKFTKTVKCFSVGPPAPLPPAPPALPPVPTVPPPPPPTA
jgi:hypothetical protein